MANGSVGVMLKMKIPEGKEKRTQAIDIVKDVQKCLKDLIISFKLPIDLPTQSMMTAPSHERDHFLMKRLAEIKIDIGKLVGSQPQERGDQEFQAQNVYSALDEVQGSLITAMRSETEEMKHQQLESHNQLLQKMSTL